MSWTVSLFERGDYSEGDFNDEVIEQEFDTLEEAKASWLASQPGADISCNES
jgi:hypothetical protein